MKLLHITKSLWIAYSKLTSTNDEKLPPPEKITKTWTLKTSTVNELTDTNPTKRNV